MKNKENKNLRRQIEVLKAQLNSSPVTQKQVAVQTEKATENKNPRAKVKEEEASYTLNIKEIKRDLLKTTIFMLFSVGIIVLLSLTEAKWGQFIF